mmetsp:Transcript_16831/g.64086  ORF Transcript_16831/g.64086 Transcript_16831/m.64086 type:complete len:211 (+) Transcript_16831:1108-1740(+)
MALGRFWTYIFPGSSPFSGGASATTLADTLMPRPSVLEKNWDLLTRLSPQPMKTHGWPQRLYSSSDDPRSASPLMSAKTRTEQPSTTPAAERSTPRTKMSAPRSTAIPQRWSTITARSCSLAVRSSTADSLSSRSRSLWADGATCSMTSRSSRSGCCCTCRCLPLVTCCRIAAAAILSFWSHRRRLSTAAAERLFPWCQGLLQLYLDSRP